MYLIKVDESNQKKFINFFKNRYLNQELKRDSMSSLLINLLKGKTVMLKSVEIEPIMVIKDEKIIMIAVLAYAHRMNDYIQIGFFEAIEDDQEAFNMILSEALKMAKKKGARKISGTLNVHVNYGLGFLADGSDTWQSFGSPHNPQFYNKLFENAGFEKIEMVSFKSDMNDLNPIISTAMKQHLNKRYTVREVNFKDLKNEARIYTEINNKAFNNHIFYYPRVLEEDLELFNEFKYLLKSENLLFVEKDGVEVGFMLWYPDFHKLMNKNETVGLKTVIKNKIFSNKIDTFKIVEIGVIPQEQKRGAILSLLDHCYEVTKGKYKYFESGWVIKENISSLALGLRWADNVHKKYNAFTKDVDYDI